MEFLEYSLQAIGYFTLIILSSCILIYLLNVKNKAKPTLYLIGFFAGALIGYDWVRVFKRFYPTQYEEIELKIIELQNSNTLFD